MYTSDIKRAPVLQSHALPRRNKKDERRKRSRGKLLKIAGVYALLSVLAIVFDRVYALFSHGISSLYMSGLFLIPLLGGAFLFGFLALIAPLAPGRKGWRVGFNLYSSGIATLAAGSLLRGIFEIAGTASGYTVLFFIAGCLLMGAGICCWLFGGASPATPREKMQNW